jgi:hypothetical protein
VKAMAVWGRKLQVCVRVYMCVFDLECMYVSVCTYVRIG